MEESHTYEYSPEQNILLSEGEAPLISTEPESSDPNLSPPFVRPPIEDRSKYEKLIQGVYDVTSNSSSEEENVKVKKKKKINIPEKLQSVYKTVELPLKSLRSERAKTDERVKKSHKSRNKSVDVDSDDSIGSASDLKANEDRTEIAEKGDTISESIQTCGSSAYHAECESMATREEVYLKKKPRHHQNKQIENDQSQNEDIRFVGHGYGDKPLLMDDELDSDCEAKFQKWQQIPNKNNQDSSWFTLPSSMEDGRDVFALAPFEKPKHKNMRIKNEEEQDIVQVVNIEQAHAFYIEPFANFLRDKSYDSTVRDTPSRTSLNPFLSMETPVIPQQNISIPEPTNTNRDVFTHIPNDTKFQGGFSDPEFNCEFPEAEHDTILAEEKFHSDNIKPEGQDIFDQNNLQDFNKNESSNEHFKHSDKTPKSKKDKKRDKYQLIDEPSNETSEGTSAKPVKVSRNAHSYKKVNVKPKKSSIKLKVDGGFSNMSFEDFPVDERNVIESSIMPYEVLRSPQQEEKKFGSKRIGNPFS